MSEDRIQAAVILTVTQNVITINLGKGLFHFFPVHPPPFHGIKPHTYMWLPPLLVQNGTGCGFFWGGNVSLIQPSCAIHGSLACFMALLSRFLVCSHWKSMVRNGNAHIDSQYLCMLKDLGPWTHTPWSQMHALSFLMDVHRLFKLNFSGEFSSLLS